MKFEIPEIYNTVKHLKKIYADFNATAPVKDIIIKSFPEWLNTYYGNPSSLHQPGQAAKHAMELARGSVAKSLGANESEIIFTSGGTESDALGLFGLAKQYQSKIKRVLVSAIEHSAVLGQAEIIKSLGLDFVEIPVLPNGVLDLNVLERLINNEPVLVSIMLANNETGIVQPVKDIVMMVKKYDGFIHCDAVQAFCKMNFSVKDLGVDTLSVSGHKIGALRGIGVLYIRKGLRVKSLFGDGSHEKEIRPGTENLPGILSLGKACEIKTDWSALQMNIRKFEDTILKKFDVKIAGQNVLRIPNTSSVAFKNQNKDVLLAGLDLKGIYASAGSACKASLSMPSHVLKAMGYDKQELKSVLRFSFGPDVSSADFDYLVECLAELLKK